MSGARTKLLYLIKGLGPGGAEQLLVNHLELHNRAHFDVQVCYLMRVKSHKAADVAATGATVFCLDAARSLDLRWVLRLWRFLAAHPADVVHVHSPLVAAATRVWFRLRRRNRPALVYTEHNRWPRHDRLTRLANRLTCSIDDKQLAVSQDVRQSMPRRVRSGVEVLSHGIDLTAAARARAGRDAMRRDLGLGDGDVAVGIVANLRREKRHDLWLAAVAQAAREESSLVFLSVGQGRLADEIRAAGQALGLGPRLRFLGFRRDALQVTAALDIFTLTSDHEGRPVALMEAMALGVPVVVTAAGGIPEMVTDQAEGLVVPIGSVDGLASGYVTLARDRAQRTAMGEQARSRAQTFGAAAATRRLEEIYSDLAADAARRRGTSSSSYAPSVMSMTRC